MFNASFVCVRITRFKLCKYSRSLNILIDCPINYYGRDCINRCLCQNGGKCDSRDGHCFCLSGFTGHQCESPCPQGMFGHMCLQKCQCGGDNICHPRTGKIRENSKK